MGFLGKLFGGSSKNNYEPSADLMAENNFWDLIQTSYNEASGDIDLQEERLTARLHTLPLQDIILFQNRYYELHGRAYTWPLWGAAYIINGGCSDDSFSYFRDWLISRGREVYTKASADPEFLATLDLGEEPETDAEGLGYIAIAVFEERTGEELPAGYKENIEISGEEWEEEGDDLERMFPRLWAKYS